MMSQQYSCRVGDRVLLARKHRGVWSVRELRVTKVEVRNEHGCPLDFLAAGAKGMPIQLSPFPSEHQRAYVLPLKEEVDLSFSRQADLLVARKPGCSQWTYQIISRRTLVPLAIQRVETTLREICFTRSASEIDWCLGKEEVVGGEDRVAAGDLSFPSISRPSSSSLQERQNFTRSRSNIFHSKGTVRELSPTKGVKHEREQPMTLLDVLQTQEQVQRAGLSLVSPFQPSPDLAKILSRKAETAALVHQMCATAYEDLSCQIEQGDPLYLIPVLATLFIDPKLTPFPATTHPVDVLVLKTGRAFYLPERKGYGHTSIAALVTPASTLLDAIPSNLTSEGPHLLLSAPSIEWAKANLPHLCGRPCREIDCRQWQDALHAIEAHILQAAALDEQLRLASQTVRELLKQVEHLRAESYAPAYAFSGLEDLDKRFIDCMQPFCRKPGQNAARTSIPPEETLQRLKKLQECARSQVRVAQYGLNSQDEQRVRTVQSQARQMVHDLQVQPPKYPQFAEIAEAFPVAAKHTSQPDGQVLVLDFNGFGLLTRCKLSPQEIRRNCYVSVGQLRFPVQTWSCAGGLAAKAEVDALYQMAAEEAAAPAERWFLATDFLPFLAGVTYSSADRGGDLPWEHRTFLEFLHARLQPLTGHPNREHLIQLFRRGPPPYTVEDVLDLRLPCESGYGHGNVAWVQALVDPLWQSTIAQTIQALKSSASFRRAQQSTAA